MGNLVNKTAIVRDGIVENIILAGPEFAQGDGEILVALSNEMVSIGDIWDGAVFTPAPPAPVPVPSSVTPLQMRKALRQVGLKPAVDAYVASLADEEAVEEWEYAISMERGNPMLNSAAALLGMTEEQVDDLFRLAAQIS